MQERRLRYGVLWVAVAAALLVGAGLVMSAQPELQAYGLALLGLPLVAFTGLGFAYYLRSRRR